MSARLWYGALLDSRAEEARKEVMMADFAESLVEQATVEWFADLGYTVLRGGKIAPGEPLAERNTYGEVVLNDRLYGALARLNPSIPVTALEEVIRKLTYTESSHLFENNHRFHRWITEGMDIAHQTGDGRTLYDKVWLLDFAHPENNDWLVVNQFTVVENKVNRRCDVVVFVNGLPLGVIELKSPRDEYATIKGAFNQLQTYKKDIPSLFRYNAMLVISDGLKARAGSLTSTWERFTPWRTIDGAAPAPENMPELEVLLKGMFEQRRFLDLIRHFIVFEIDGATITKKIAAYHQFHAVNKAISETLRASTPGGDRRAGVIWHTQGSGKSLSMVFYAGKIILHPSMSNPTLVILTDRNDLDDQLFGTFSLAHELLRQKPVQAESRKDLQSLLRVASGGVIFTTIQKCLPEKDKDYPLLSDRHNIVVIADEAHRSQYDFIDGFAHHMRNALPKASFIGFTGTPIELADRNTPAVFGNYIDVYDLKRAVDDGATVRIYYEARLAKLALDEAERPKIDPEFEEVTEGQEAETKDRYRNKWARLAALVGTERRLGLVAQNIVEHFEQRLTAIEGKGLIVCMSRRICVDLYQALVHLHPQWHDEDDYKGAIKVVMTGSASDGPNWQQHIGGKARRDILAKRFKDPEDPLKLVIVRDMWLTGFDVPCLHTMYLDKPMQGHGLMQAIARVNRVFKDKPGGLIVDYIGIAEQLKKALAVYTEQDRKQTGIPQEQAVMLLLEKYEIVSDMFYGLDFSQFFSGTAAQRLSVIPVALEHILQLPDGKKRFLQGVTELCRAFALATPHELALSVADQVGFFQAVRTAFAKATSIEGQERDELDGAIRQIVSKAITADGVIDIYSAVGLKSPDISILSDQFLEEMRGLPQHHLALEALQRLLHEEIKIRSSKNVVQTRSFQEKLERSVHLYQNRSLESAEIIEELIELAKEVRTAHMRGAELGLNEEELAFYDALGTNDSAVQVLGDETLKTIARELVDTVRRNVTIDWTARESVRARLRMLVKHLLRKYHYPPDKQEQATQTILQQAEVLCRDWAA
jgi:type I restriction enzyme R subunit